jgi:fructoselysine 3-epimerase
MPMKYAFNTWVYGSFPVWVPSYPLEDVIRRLARIGYDGIEIGCAAPHAWPAHLSAARRRELRGVLQSEGLAPVSLLPAPGGGPGNNAASPLAEERQTTLDHYKEVVDLAADLGAPLVLYIAGWLVFGTTREEGFERSTECLAQVARHAATRGVTIVVEPTSADSNLIETADDALELMRAAGEPNVKVMFDTYHVMYRNEVSSDYVYAMAPHLAHVHFADTDRLAPGDGEVNWRGVLQAVKDIGYDGYLTMEIGFNNRRGDPDSYAYRALSYLKALERELG